jgi:hypothetical protein
MRAAVGRLGSHLPRSRSRELPTTIFHHRVKVVDALVLSLSWHPLVDRFRLSYPMSLPATPSSRYSMPSRHHHKTTLAPSPSLPANAASTGPLFPSRRRPNEDATPSMYHESPSSSTLRVGHRNPCMVVEAVSPQLLLQSKPLSLFADSLERRLLPAQSRRSLPRSTLKPPVRSRHPPRALVRTPSSFLPR